MPSQNKPDVCFVCGVELKYMFGDEGDRGVVDNACEAVLSAGYGSRNDEHEFSLFICDNCLDKHPERVALFRRYRFETGMKEPWQPAEDYGRWARKKR